MDAQEIRELRAMLAAQAITDAPPSKSLAQKLSRLLFLRNEAAPTPSPMLPPPAPPPPSNWAKLDDPLVVCDSLDAVPTPPIPPEILLGAFCPRRPAFGQRAEETTKLSASTWAAPVSGPFAPQGGVLSETELLLDSGDAIHLPPRRPREPLHAETPFFPEDLADDPGDAIYLPAPTRVRRTPPMQAKVLETVASEPVVIAPARELAGVFLLANLAARLATEEYILRQSLAELPPRSPATPQLTPRPKHPPHQKNSNDQTGKAAPQKAKTATPAAPRARRKAAGGVKSTEASSTTQPLATHR